MSSPALTSAFCHAMNERGALRWICSVRPEVRTVLLGIWNLRHLVSQLVHKLVQAG